MTIKDVHVGVSANKRVDTLRDPGRESILPELPVGDHDRVLTPKEQKRVAEALVARILLETGSHSPKEKQGVEVGRYLCNVGMS